MEGRLNPILKYGSASNEKSKALLLFRPSPPFFLFLPEHESQVTRGRAGEVARGEGQGTGGASTQADSHGGGVNQ